MAKELQKRRYQERAVESFNYWLDQPEERLATITIPTGCGKTYSAAMCLNARPDLKVLWAAHRKELIDQAHDALKHVMPDRSISIERAKDKADSNSEIVVGSVQTLARERKHLEDFVPNVIVIDEYHHYSENNVQYDSLLKRWPDARIVGLTATPYRFGSGTLPLGRNLIHMDIGTAVEKGYLVPPVAESLITNISLADVRTKMGDFAVADLSKAVNVESRNRLICNRVIELVQSGRQGILFAVDVPHAKALHEMLKNSVRAAEVYGDTSDEDRVQIMHKIRNGEIDVLINNLVATEGFDVPHLSFVVVARPTRSLGLFIQMVGRGLRTAPNKKDCIVIDVNDKLKIKQSRITFSDMASHGDLYGDRKRALNVIKADVPIEPITHVLKNFPVFLNKDKDDRWRADEESFSISSWQLTDDQWVMTWTAEKTVPKMITRRVYKPWKKFDIDGNGIINRPVKHPRFGDGYVKKVLDGKTGKVVVEFGWENNCILMHDCMEIQTFVNEYSAKETDTLKTERLFYICMPDTEEKGRIIAFTKKANDLVLDHDSDGKPVDLRMERTLADSWLLQEAQKDDVLHLVRCGAKWKGSPATDKQKQFVEKMVTSSRITFNIDLDTLSKGEASSVIEQTKWEPLIRAKFGTNYKEKLLGYDKSEEDV